MSKPNLGRRRYPDWRNPPEACDSCGEPLVVLVENSAVYGAPRGKWPWIYLCMSCGAFVGCHPGSAYPLGLMADAATRRLRKALHVSIDSLWQSGGMTRSKAYSLLAKLTGRRRFHVGELTRDECHSANEAFRAWEAANDFHEVGDDLPW